jgi:hypothetical protein
VANNEHGFINVTKFTQVGAGHSTSAGNAVFTSLSSTYLRAAGTFDLAGWDSGLGIQNWSGTSLDGNLGVETTTKATAVDFQMQGTVGDKPLGIYATYATAPAGSTGNDVNAFNGGTHSRSAFNIAGEIGIIPEKATIGAAVRFGSSGVDDNGSNAKDNGIYLTGTYKLAQNLLGRLSFAHNTGSFWNTASSITGSTQTMAQDFGTTQYTANIYALF